MKLNCDLGEGWDNNDAQIMPHIHMANIACGGHAGDENRMRRCVSLARQYGVCIGAHPGYEDPANLGRRSLDLPTPKLQTSFYRQVERLQAVCATLGTSITYIKPHGALYNDMMQDERILRALLEICAQDYPDLSLVVQAMPDNRRELQLASAYSVPLLFEGFADRRYTDAGLLVPRSQANACYDSLEQVLEQAGNLRRGGVFSEHQQWLPINVDTLCVHGDSPLAMAAASAIRQQLHEAHA